MQNSHLSEGNIEGLTAVKSFGGIEGLREVETSLGKGEEIQNIPPIHSAEIEKEISALHDSQENLDVSFLGSEDEAESTPVADPKDPAKDVLKIMSQLSDKAARQKFNFDDELSPQVSSSSDDVAEELEIHLEKSTEIKEAVKTVEAQSAWQSNPKAPAETESSAQASIVVAVMTPPALSSQAQTSQTIPYVRDDAFQEMFPFTPILLELEEETVAQQ